MTTDNYALAVAKAVMDALVNRDKLISEMHAFYVDLESIIATVPLPEPVGEIALCGEWLIVGVGGVSSGEPFHGPKWKDGNQPELGTKLYTEQPARANLVNVRPEPFTYLIDVTTDGQSTGRYEVAAKEYWGDLSVCFPAYREPPAPAEPANVSG